MKKNINGLLLIMLLLSTIITSCDDSDDNKGDTSIKASSPTITVTVPSSSATFAEKDTTFNFTVSMSEPQIVDVPVYVNVVAGDAELDADFSLSTEKLIIVKGFTKASGSISFSPDDLPEGEETVTIQIGDDRTSNATITPQTMKFTVMNVSEGDLPVEFSWDTEFYNTSGDEILPTTVANLRLFIVPPTGPIVPVNTAAYEEYVIKEEMPDGQYTLRADVGSVINYGVLGTAPKIDLSLDFSQVGEIEHTTFTYPDAPLFGVACVGNAITLATITKVGSAYTIEKVGEKDFDLNNFIGAYNADEPNYAVYGVNFSATAKENTLANDNFWDSGIVLEYVLDGQAGTVTIPAQRFDLTAVDASLGVVEITGKGTLDPCSFEMVVDYKILKVSDQSIVEENTHTFTKL